MMLAKFILVAPALVDPRSPTLIGGFRRDVPPFFFFCAVRALAILFLAAAVALYCLPDTFGAYHISQSDARGAGDGRRQYPCFRGAGLCSAIPRADRLVVLLIHLHAGPGAQTSIWLDFG